MTAMLTVNLRAADGATFDLQVPAPRVRRATVRLADVRAYSVTAVRTWDGTKWVTS